MHQPDPPFPPGDADRTKRRGLFSGRTDPAPPPMTGPTPRAAERAEAEMSVYHRMVQEQIEEGLRRIQHTANALMHEIAGEVWRAAGGDERELRSKILESLSRDQAIRGLIAHADERFQALALRTARLEDTLNLLAESVRGAKEQLARSVEALEDAKASPALGTAEIRAQLAEVSRQVGAALDTLAERDRAIVESVRERIRGHGELVAAETARISDALQAYVQQGVEAIGRLAGGVDAQIRALASRDERIGARIEEAVRAQTEHLGEQLQLMYERMAIDAASFHETVTAATHRTEGRIADLAGFVEHLHERIGVESRDLAQRIGSVESGVAGDVAARMTDGIGERIDRLEAATAARVLELGEDARRAATHAAQELQRTLEARVMGLAQLVRSDAEVLRRELVRTAKEHDEALAGALDERLGEVSEALTSATYWMVEELARRTNAALREHLERMGEHVSERAARAAEAAVGERLDDTRSRMRTAVEQVERATAELAGSAGVVEEQVARAVDGRIASLAKLIRSDNETLASQIAAGQEASKQALRAMKELQASLPAEVIDMVERRFASLAESLERSNEMLAKRIDRMADQIGERYDTDIQVVIDRMGDAMHALASLGRSGQPQPGRRIELD